VVAIAQHRKLLHWFSLGGILGPGLCFVMDGAVTAAQPNYNPIRDYVSMLTAPGHPGGGFVAAGWIVFPVLFLPFVAAVYEASTKGRWWTRATAFLLTVFSICACLCGIFHCDRGCEGKVWTAQVHIISSTISSGALFPCPFLLWMAAREEKRWSGFTVFSWLIQLAGAGAVVLLVLAYLHEAPLAGLAERSYWGVYYLWTIVVSVGLFRSLR
jgi:hypothetical membrane protein